MPLYTRISLGLLAGIAVGISVNLTGVGESDFWTALILPLLSFTGTAFIRAITMIVIPLVAASLTLGVASLGDLGKLGRMGGKTLGYFLVTTAIAISIGLSLALLVRPGSRIDPASRDALSADFMASASDRVGLAAARPPLGETLLGMIPSNPIASAAQGELLPLIVFVVLFAAALTLVEPVRRDAVLNFVAGVNDAAMVVIEWIMKLAPFAVFALITGVISRFGLDVLRTLAIYSLVVIAGLFLHQIFTYGTSVALLGRMNPLDFFRRIRKVLLIGFSTSSSNATLPVTMETAEEELGISNSVASFVLPLGATINMDGTALLQGVATVFIAQVYGVELHLPELLTIVLTATLASIGTAGVPSAGIVTLILVLQSVGLGSHAAAGIALILGVDRLLDMLRTAVNISGDLAAALFVARSEGELRVPGELGTAPITEPRAAEIGASVEVKEFR